MRRLWGYLLFFVFNDLWVLSAFLSTMAVEAVLSKPLSRPDSLLSGINTGISGGTLRETPLHYPTIPLNPGDFPRLLLD